MAPVYSPQKSGKIRFFYYNEFYYFVCVSGLSGKLTFKTFKKLDCMIIYQFHFL